jgi:hypothetical protein
MCIHCYKPIVDSIELPIDFASRVMTEQFYLIHKECVNKKKVKALKVEGKSTKRPIHITLNADINLDGREIGRLTGKHILRNISGVCND